MSLEAEDRTAGDSDGSGNSTSRSTSDWMELRFTDDASPFVASDMMRVAGCAELVTGWCGELRDWGEWWVMCCAG